ncbi:MAG: DUF5317 domain-containing protein [Acidimicrobiia bacterium]|nr:DUF5317 domain-containing protein [Acidimicrobiia bacterium]
MLWLALVLFVATTIALLRGGRLANLADIRLRLWWLLPLGFAVQATPALLPDDAAWTPDVGVGLVLISYLPLLLLVILNRERKGMWLAGLGVLMNFSVIAANGGMPVLAEAALAAGRYQESLQVVYGYKHVALDAGTFLSFLADVIPVRLFGHGQVISLGDVLLAVGMGAFLEDELRQPVRWFKHGQQTEGGSASSR